MLPQQTQCNIFTLDRTVNQETGVSGRRYRNIILTCGWVEFCADAYAQRKQVDVKQLYNQVPQTALVQLVFDAGRVQFKLQSQFDFQWQLGTGCRSESQRQTEGLCPQDPGWAAQQNEEVVLLWSEELGVNMWQSVPSPTHHSHLTYINPFATLSKIKCERYIFSKEVCSFVIIVDYVSVYSGICIMWLYSTNILCFIDCVYNVSARKTEQPRISLKVIDWLIDFNGISTRIGSYNASRFENNIHWRLIYAFCWP